MQTGDVRITDEFGREPAPVNDPANTDQIDTDDINAEDIEASPPDMAAPGTGAVYAETDGEDENNSSTPVYTPVP